jgi:hypothetical protein
VSGENSIFLTESMGEMSAYEEKARKWNIWVTVFLTVILCVPLPFARFETWPGLDIISEHIIAPWSRFRLCYAAYPGGETVEDVYAFSWKGQLRNGDGSNPQFLHPGSLGPVALKWQNGPEIVLKDAYAKGELIRLETTWQPMIVWPFKMIWRIKEHFKVPVVNR